MLITVLQNGQYIYSLTWLTRNNAPHCPEDADQAEIARPAAKIAILI
jgi:hypothetical protein